MWTIKTFVFLINWFWINMQMVMRGNPKLLFNSIPNCVVRFQGCRDCGGKNKELYVLLDRNALWQGMEWNWYLNERIY